MNPNFKEKCNQLEQDVIDLQNQLDALQQQFDALEQSCYGSDADSGDGGSDGGDGGDGVDTGSSSGRFYRDGPPVRDGTTVVYDDSYSGSLQDAYEELSEGDTLYIDPADGPYSGRITLLDDPKDHITIDGGGELSFNEDGTYSVETPGAEIHHPDDGTKHVIGTLDSVSGSRPALGAQTELSKPVRGGGFADQGVTDAIGNTTLHVTDASALAGAEGELIYVKESVRPYQEPESGDAGAPGTTFETNILKSVDVDTDTIELQFPVYQDYPLVAATEVGTIHHQVSDVRITGLDLVGGVDDATALTLMGVNEGWVDNVRLSNTVGAHAVTQANSYRMHYEDVAIADTDRYGVNITRGSTDTYLSNIHGEEVSRYVVRHGSSSHDRAHSSAGTLIEGVRGENMNNNIVANAHWGGFYLETRDMTVGDGARTQRFRSRHVVVRGADVGGSVRVITHAQRPHTCLATGLNVSLSDTSQHVFDFSSLDGSGSIYGDQRGENLRYEDIAIDPYGGKDSTEIGQFGNVEIDGLHFRNVTYDGQPLTESDVKAWDGWADANVTNLTVE